MAPVPYTATGRLNIEVTVSSLVHKTRVPCDLVIPVTSPVELAIRVPSSSNVAASVAAQALWDLMRGNYGTTVPAATYLIEQNFGGVFVPLESGVLTGIGASSSPTQITNQLTLTYKDVLNRKMKVVLLENAIPAPGHGIVPSGDAPLDSLITSFLSTATPGSPGNWATSRGNAVISRFTFFTLSLNKRVRRSRHLV